MTNLLSTDILISNAVSAFLSQPTQRYMDHGPHCTFQVRNIVKAHLKIEISPFQNLSEELCPSSAHINDDFINVGKIFRLKIKRNPSALRADSAECESRFFLHKIFI